MTYLGIDVNLSSETKSMLLEVQKFSMEVMRPAGVKLDGHSAPEDVIAEGSALWEVFRGFRSLGLHLLQIPKGLGGMAEDLDLMAAILVTEQLGYADSGLTISMGVSCMPFNYAALFPIPEMKQMARDFCADKEGKLFFSDLLLENELLRLLYSFVILRSSPL
jgi:alkylation response protein AidB-like acyl-CoA dehydrogenase